MTFNKHINDVLIPLMVTGALQSVDQESTVRFEKYLQGIVTDKTQVKSIACFLAKVALEKIDPLTFFKDLCIYGCKSGMIHALNYKEAAFFEMYHEEIISIHQTHNISIDSCKEDKIHLCWTAIEMVAEQVYQDWEQGS